MTGRPPSARPRPRSLWSGAFFVALAAAGAAASLPAPVRLAAQVPDSVARDTARVPPQLPDPRRRPPGDTLAQDTAAADTLPPPPTLPVLERAGPVGWAAGVWQWERDDLLRFPDLTLLQLLERIPGLTAVRPGILGQAEGGAVFGAAAGGIRYVLDGYALDPLVAPTFDPSRLALLSLERVRVERRVTGATVYLRSLTPTDPQPESVVEAATGDFDTNLFRGTFLAPRVLGGSLGLGFERLATDVGGGANHLAGWVRWSVVHDSTGLQLELRQSDMDRSGAVESLAGARRDWAVRGRTRLGPIRAELYGGVTTVEDERSDVVLREGSAQGGARVSTELDVPVPLEATAALRLRSHPRVPAQELELGLWAAPAPWLGIGGEVVQGWWDGPQSTGRWSARARAGPALGLTAFAEIFDGGPLLGDGAHELFAPGIGDRAPVAVERDGLRAGVEGRWGGLALGAAAIRTSADSAHGFGLAFDPTAPAFGGGDAEGVEAMARLPTFLDPVWLEGWYVGLDAPASWPYVPRHQWRAALVYHHFPLPSGNLELYARVEHAVRGGMTVPVYPDAESPEAEAGRVGALRTTNLELVIRVLTVRAFVRWENLLHQLGQEDLPGFVLPGQHVSYGVKWRFWN